MVNVQVNRRAFCVSTDPSRSDSDYEQGRANMAGWVTASSILFPLLAQERI